MMAQHPRHFHQMEGSNTGDGGGGYPHYPFAGGADTTHTKIFVGGLAWETQRDTMRRYFEQFGDILEAVVITDKHTGRSKGYGFVTFRDADSAMRACQDPTPVIDGRRANCNLASLGAVQRPRQQHPASHYGMGRFRPAMSSSHLRGSSAAAASLTAYYRPATQYPYPNYSFYGYTGGYSQENMYPATFYGIGGSGAQAHHHISPYYPAAGQSFVPSFYPYYTQIGQASQPQGGGMGLHYAQAPPYTPYYPQHYGSSSGILSLPTANSPAAGQIGVQFSDGSSGTTGSAAAPLALRAPPSTLQQHGATPDLNSSA